MHNNRAGKPLKQLPGSVIILCYGNLIKICKEFFQLILPL